MGNVLSRLIASLFGDKEIRILILGLDNGMFLGNVKGFSYQNIKAVASNHLCTTT